MFRAVLSSSSRLTASSSSSPTSSFFHTSSSNLSQASKRTSTRNRKKNIARTAERHKQAAALRPSVVLGTRTTEEAKKWGECKLSQVLITEEDLTSTTATLHEKISNNMVEFPKYLGHGVAQAEKQFLFESLPEASVRMTSQLNSLAPVVGKKLEKAMDPYPREARKAALLAKALDLRNANAAGIAFENRRRIIKAFSTPENPFDPGRTEVQLALLTYKIRNLWTHLKTFKRDVGNRRSLRTLIHQRASLLRYLKGSNRGRYDAILEQLALEPESVEGELVV